MFIVPDARSEVGVEESKENVANWTTVVTPTKRPAAAAAKSASVHVFHASVERRRGVSECPVLPETVWIRRCCSRRWWRRRTTQHEVNDIYTCFPPGPLTRSAITTAVESARAPGPSLSPSPSPRRVFWRDASTRPLRESNRSPAPAIVTPQKSPRRVQVRAELYRGLTSAILPLPPQSLIIWDEAPMTHRHCYEAVDRTLRFIMGRRPAHTLPARLPAGG